MLVKAIQKPKNINDAQWRCVCHNAGHLLILAGPGTGKTHTLTHRILHLIPQLSPQHKILAITFTNKAAQQMDDRISALSPDGRKFVTVGTFHSFCLSLLRQHHRFTNLPENFRVAEAGEIEQLLKTGWNLPARELSSVLEEISRWKSFFTRQTKPSRLKEYNEILRSNGLVDFDDLINETMILLSNSEKVAKQVRQTFRFVCVDEYQDLNAIQHAFLKELIKDGVVLTAIGDPNQAIYGFRGSNPKYFFQFENDFPDGTMIMLRENYRSTENILSASGQVIALAPEQTSRLDAIVQIDRQGRLVVHESPTDRSEAEFIVSQIEQLMDGTSMFSKDSKRVKNGGPSLSVGFSDLAVIYRLNAQKHALIEAFDRSGIPYQVCAQRSLQLPPEIINALLKHSKDLGGERAVEIIRKFAAGAEGQALIQADDRLMRQWAMIEQLAERMNSVEELIDQAALQKPEDYFDFQVEKVSLMTIHASKGLEFSAVFMAGCEEGLLPLNLPGMTSDVDEERRLFYVGMTRAREFLCLTRALKRPMHGQTLNNPASRFIGDIQDELKTYERLQAKPRRDQEKKDDRQLTLF